MSKIRCRLSELLRDKWMEREALSRKAGLSLERVNQYCDNALTVMDIAEIERILEAVDAYSLSDLFELVLPAREPAADATTTLTGEDEWHSHCPASANGRHDWYRDAEVSNAIYQEYECRACGLRIHEIW